MRKGAREPKLLSESQGSALFGRPRRSSAIASASRMTSLDGGLRYCVFSLTVVKCAAVARPMPWPQQCRP